MFDPDKFLNQEHNAAFSTKFVPVPETEYVATVPQGGVHEPREMTIDGEKRYVVDIDWEISKDDPGYVKAKEETGMNNPKVRQGLFLDVLTDANGEVTGLADGPGKNVQLGRLRDALSMNDPRKRWSFRHFEGSTARIKVVHAMSKGETYANVAVKDGVAKV